MCCNAFDCAQERVFLSPFHYYKKQKQFSTFQLLANIYLSQLVMKTVKTYLLGA